MRASTGKFAEGGNAAQPEGVPDHVLTVNENCGTLKFDSYGFEEE